MRFLFVFRSVEWIGVEYISASLKRAGHETDMAFEADLGGTFYFGSRSRTHGSIIEKVREFGPDMVLFSSTTQLFPWVKEVSRDIKEHFDIPILVGGIHATIQPEEVLSDDHIDMVCVGEGEEAIVELADRMQEEQDYSDTRNIWLKSENGLIKNPVRPLIRDLDELPFPDKDLFYKYGCFRKRAYVMATRGCPYNCPYCFNHQLKRIYKDTRSLYVRRRSVGSVIEELNGYRKRYGINSVHFYDDTFTLDEGWVMEFAERYGKEIGLPFYCLVRPDHVNERMIEALRKAGCVSMGMGIESGNDHVRNQVLKRNMSNEQILEAARIIKAQGIKLVTFNMFGFPGEDTDQMLDTMRINLDLRPDSLFTFIFYPFPGTDALRMAVEQGCIDDQSMEMIMNGEGGFQRESVLDHPYKGIAYNMKVILPLLNKMPRSTHDYFLKKWVFREHSGSLLSIISLVSLPFYSSWESWERAREQISMFKVRFTS